MLKCVSSVSCSSEQGMASLVRRCHPTAWRFTVRFWNRLFRKFSIELGGKDPERSLTYKSTNAKSETCKLQKSSVQSDRQFETASAHMANIVSNSPHNTTTQKKKKYQTKQLITLDQYKSELLQTKANLLDALLKKKFHP